ncbi:hypothetical protein [Mesorhizobium sp.]|uniref:hypothetical protein n=1 Tax=Mesorhizobium sp. TaxID=1871066 RepID=UPI000FE534AF|nr:hypothetical protein [Mesorhizobium sp.]RWE78801.1 MAG: hypothetical protein EOS42_04250 [Mesorhizobium sp.]
MTRVRIDENGIAIAKPSYDVDTAPLSKMSFSPQFVAMQLVMKGLVTVADYSGYMSGSYRRAVVTFPMPFLKPPIVLAAGQFADGGVDITAITGAYASDQNNVAGYEPIYQTVISTTGFELYVIKASWAQNPTRPLDWRYWVFRNTLED